MLKEQAHLCCTEKATYAGRPYEGLKWFDQPAGEHAAGQLSAHRQPALAKVMRTSAVRMKPRPWQRGQTLRVPPGSLTQPISELSRACALSSGCASSLRVLRRSITCAGLASEENRQAQCECRTACPQHLCCVHGKQGPSTCNTLHAAASIRTQRWAAHRVCGRQGNGPARAGPGVTARRAGSFLELSSCSLGLLRRCAAGCQARRLSRARLSASTC